MFFNIGDYIVLLGVFEVFCEGIDLILVIYGSCIRIVEDVCDLLV